MAFHGKTFVFNSVPCEAYELELYNIGSTGQGGGEFASIVSVEEEVVGNRWKPYFYGTKYEEKLELEMAGICKDAILGSDMTDSPRFIISPEDYALYMHDPVHPTKAGYGLWWTPKFEEALIAVLA